MPLKHITETLLILILGAVLIVTGLLTGSLPALPQGMLPWAGLFVLTLAYPLGLYGLLRRHRADYWFRVLHFAPMLLTLLWMLIQLISYKAPSFIGFTTGLIAAGVIVALGLLALFCLHVIRRRGKRVGSLAVLAVLFAMVSVHAGRTGWQREMGATLWTGLPTMLAGKPDTFTDDGKNLGPSSDPAEEAWRQKLRDMVNGSSKPASGSSSSRTLIAKQESSSSKPPVVQKPKRLPKSGPGIEVLGTVLVAGYCGVVHRRARKRMIA